MVFLSKSIGMVYYINGFPNIELIFVGINISWLWCSILLMWHWIMFPNILLVFLHKY